MIKGFRLASGGCPTNILLTVLALTPPSPENLRRIRRGLRAFTWLLGLFAIFGVAGALFGPPLAKRVLEKEVSEQIGRKLSVASITVNPYSLSVSLDGIAIEGRDGAAPFLEIESVFVDAELSSIFRAAPVLASLQVTRPKLRLVRNADKTYSISDIIEKILAKPSSPDPARFALSNMVIDRGIFEFDDMPAKAKHRIHDLNLAVPFVSSLSAFANDPVQPKFSAVVNGAPVELKGDTRPFVASLDTALNMEIEKVDLPFYLDYLPIKLGADLVSASFGAKFAVSFKRGKDGIAALSLSGTADLDRLEIKEKKAQGGRPMIKLPRLAVEFGPIDIVGREVEIASIKAEGLDLNLRREKDGRLNLASIVQTSGAEKALAAAKPATAIPEPAAKPFVVNIKSLSLDNGRIAFTDETPEQAFQTVAENASLRLENLTTREGQTGRVELAFKTKAGEAVGANGNFSMAPVSAELALEVGKLKLARLAPYFAPRLKFEVADGTLDLKTTIKHGEAGTVIGLQGLDLSGIRLTRDGADWATLASLIARDGEIDVGKRSVRLGELTASDGSALVRRDKNGDLNVYDLVVTPAASATAAKEDGPPWTLALKKLSLDKLGAHWEDLSGTDPVKIALGPVNLEATGVSMQPGTSIPFKLAAGIGRGKLSASGDMRLSPVSGTINLDAQGLEFLPLQPYFARFVNITVNSGSINAKGKLTLETVAGGALRTGFTGEAAANDFAAVDKLMGEPLLRWKSLAFNGLGVRTEPFALDMNEIAATDFYSRLIVSPDGKINVQGLVVSDKSPDVKPVVRPGSSPALAPTPAPMSPVRIGKVTLQGGRVDFSDRFIKPNYSARITELGGQVSGLSAVQESRADVALKGRVEGTALLDIKGTINPLAKVPFLDLAAAVKGVELSSFSPYSSRYIGYVIEKGKLNLDLKYHLEDRKLDASNKIFLDQLTLGDKVESPDALNIPVQLAISLLKNSRGEIDIELPISGSLDDPQFSIGGLIVKVIVNLIVKAVTSPFALLGSIFGGGGSELSYVEFAPGFANLSEAATTKLKSLAKALTDRSALKIDISGRADAATDRDGLKRRSLTQKVRAQKVAELVRRGTPVASNAEVRVEPAEYGEYLKRVYDRENFAKPRNAIGIAQTLPVPEMERLILDNTTVSEDELRELSHRRARAVKNWLEKDGEIPDERLFLVAGRASGGDESKGAPANRVDLILK